MIIKLSPVRDDEVLTVERQGDALIINGEELDFSPLPEGALLPAEAIACRWIEHPVERINGQLVITLTAPHGADAREAARFPEDLVDPPNGPVSLPQ